MLNPEALAAMRTASAVLPHKDKPDFRQGLVWQLVPLNGRRIALHLGGDPGSTTIAAVDLDRNAAALVFANISPNAQVQRFQKQLLKQLLERAAA